jgi:predicted nucleic acid-binding protein
LKEKHYLDSCIFLGYLNKEPDKFSDCYNLIRAAEVGIIDAYTSVFTGAELIKIKNSSLGDDEIEKIIQTVLNASWLNLISFEREVAYISRHLSRKYGLKPADAVHLATAIRFGVDYFDTTDLKDFASKDIPTEVGFLPEYKNITIQYPIVHGYTPELFT